MIKFKSIIFFCLVAMLANTAFSADTQTPNADSIMGVTAALEAIFGQNLLIRFVQGGLDISSSLITYAKILAGTLALVHLTWQIIINIINNKDILEGALEEILFATVVVFLLSIYPVIVKDIVDLGQEIMNRASNGGVANAVSRFIRAMFSQVSNIIEQDVATLSKGKWWDFIANSIDMILAFIISIVTLIFCALAIVEVMSVVLLGPVVVGLSIALGPMFVAMLATGWTRQWFNQWINFFVNGAVLTAILAIVLNLISNVMMNQITALGSGTSLTGGAIAMMILSLTLGKIIGAVPHFADALLPGRTSAGKAQVSGKDMVNQISNPAKTVANLFKRA